MIGENISSDATGLQSSAVNGLNEVSTKLTEGSLSALTAAQGNVVQTMAGGSDLQVVGGDALSRSIAMLAGIYEVKKPAIVLGASVAQADKIEEICKVLSLSTAKCVEPEDFKKVGSATVLVTTVKVFGAALKSGERIARALCIVDGVETILSDGTLSELENMLTAWKEQSPDGQVVLSANEPSLNLAALSRRFLNEPKTVSIKSEGGEDVEHWYYEVGTALLAKPQALCDLVEVDEGKRLVVFCNSPSDADFADVILKKRGISSQKLIGYVPQLKLSKAVQQVQKGECTVLVLTDVAARGVPLEEFDIVINYAVPTDPEVYFHRYTSGQASKTKKVVSLVSAVDLANFHYLKKLGKLELRKGELPSAEQLFANKFDGLKKQALEKSFHQESSIAQLVDQVLSSEASKPIIGLLLYNTLTVIPSMRPVASAQARDERSDEGEMEEEDEGQPNRRSNNAPSRSNDRRGRNDNRSDNRSDNNNRRRGRDDNRDGGGDRPQFRDRNEESQPLDEDDDQQQERPQRERAPRRQQIPVDRDYRLYVGQGSRQGLTRDQLVEVLTSQCGVTPDTVKRVFIRDCYSFVDVPEAIADDVAEKLGAISFKDSDKYFVRKAVVISVPKEGGAPEPDGSSAESAEISDDRRVDDDHRDEDEGNGPTLLAVDEA